MMIRHLVPVLETFQDIDTGCFLRKKPCGCLVINVLTPSVVQL